jgi:hypothetical protein
MLHMTRVAFGAENYEALVSRISAHMAVGVVKLTTRYRPKRHEELIGGSLYWIIKHRLVARSEILEFGDAEDGRTHIVIAAKLVPVEIIPRRAHQGWRYLEEKDAPPDLVDGQVGGDPLPPGLNAELSDLGLM